MIDVLEGSPARMCILASGTEELLFETELPKLPMFNETYGQTSPDGKWIAYSTLHPN